MAEQQNLRQWEERSERWGATLKSVLFKNAPESLNAHVDAWHASVISGILKRYPAQTILDVGCGYGRMAEKILRQNPSAQITGIDISDRFVTLFRERTGMPAHAADLTSLPPGLGTFDCILCVTVLMYCPGEKTRDAIASLLSHLGPKGVLVLIEPCYWGAFFSSGLGLASLMQRKTPDGPRGRTFTTGEMRNWISSAGGRVIGCERNPVTTVFFPLLYATGRVLPKKLLPPLFWSCSLFDNMFSRFPLPSLQTAWIVTRA